MLPETIQETTMNATTPLFPPLINRPPADRFHVITPQELAASIALAAAVIPALDRATVVARRSDIGISAAILLIRLAALDQGAGLTMTEAAAACVTKTSGATTLGDALENKGLVERRRGEKDRRVVRLHVTDAGRMAVMRANGK